MRKEGVGWDGHGLATKLRKVTLRAMPVEDRA